MELIENLLQLLTTLNPVSGVGNFLLIKMVILVGMRQIRDSTR